MDIEFNIEYIIVKPNQARVSKSLRKVAGE